MFKLRNFKILLLLMLFAFAGQSAWAGGGGDDNSYAGTWFTFRARYSATGEGKVYGDFTEKSNAVNKKNENVATRHRHAGGGTETGDTYTGNDIDLHLFAEASDGWEFVEWRDNDGNKLSTSTPCDANGNATSESTKYGYAKVPRFKSKNVCARNLSSGEGASDTAHVSQHKIYSENVNNRVDAYYVAVFSKLISGPIVTAEPLDETLGLASFSPGDNQVGDVVTLATHPTGPKDKGYENKFLGWQHNGEYLRDDQNHIIRDNPYSFEVTEDNAGVYYAVYESGYVFHRIKNYVTQDYFVATGDNVAGTGITALPNALAQNFDMQNDARVNAGSIYEINSYKNTDGSGRLVYNLKVQNKETKDYYSLPSIYIRLNQDADKNAWNFSTSVDDGQGTRLRVNEEGVQSVSSVLDDRSLWYIEPIDKDLETCENYFSLDPNKLVEVDGKYYTTLRTSWNILFNPEQMTPYIVKSVDETAGTFEMEAISGNIIPAGTPVIIKTKSNDIEENRMVPTTTNAASGAVPTGNLLQVSTKYFPNQAAPVANCKGLYKNADGQLAFGGSTLSTVNGNEAYLSVAKEVVLPSKISNITLADLLASGDTEKIYNVIDLTGVNVVAHDELLICKDNNGYAKKDANTEGYVDFMHNTSGLTLTVPQTYDQSNWIGLRRPEGQEFSANVLGRPLKGVVGKLIDTINPELQLTQVPTATPGTPASMNLNPYIAASFYGVNHQKGTNDKEYFFVQPKPMELANIEWVQWNGEKFVAVNNEAHTNWNTAKLQGEFEFNGSYLEQGGVFLEAGHIYKMCPAVVKYNDGTNHPHVYVIGTVNDLNSGDWNPNKGVEMWTRDGNIYTATLTVNDADNGAGYFSFTKKLGASWDDINAYRFGADTESMEYAGNYPVSESDLDTELPMRADWSDGTRPFKLSSGTYRLTVNLRTMKLIVSKTKVTASGRDGSRQYVVYPLALHKVTSEEGGVITGLRDLTNPEVIGTDYYNTTGMRSSRPWPGVNIVVTRYSDGSRSAVKVVK